MRASLGSRGQGTTFPVLLSVHMWPLYVTRTSRCQQLFLWSSCDFSISQNSWCQHWNLGFTLAVSGNWPFGRDEDSATRDLVLFAIILQWPYHSFIFLSVLALPKELLSDGLHLSFPCNMQKSRDVKHHSHRVGGRLLSSFVSKASISLKKYGVKQREGRSQNTIVETGKSSCWGTMGSPYMRQSLFRFKGLIWNPSF